MKDVICEMKETSEVSLRLPQFTVLRVSTAQAEPADSLGWGNSWEFSETEATRVHRTEQPGGEGRTDTPGLRTTGPPQLPAEHYSRTREGSPRARETPRERIRRKSGWCTHKACNSVCFHQPDWKTPNSRGPGEGSQEVVVWAVADTQPEIGHISGPASQSTTDKSERTCYPITLLHPQNKAKKTHKYVKISSVHKGKIHNVQDLIKDY